MAGKSPSIHLCDVPHQRTPEQDGEFAGRRDDRLAVTTASADALIERASGFGVDAYGVLIALVSAPSATLSIGELGERRNLSPSGVSRSVDRLAKIDLVERRTNPADGRSQLVGLTPHGLARLRAAQVTHHAVARELLLDHLDERDLERLGELWEKAMPGSVSSPVWPLYRAHTSRIALATTQATRRTPLKPPPWTKRP